MRRHLLTKYATSQNPIFSIEIRGEKLNSRRRYLALFTRPRTDGGAEVMAVGKVTSRRGSSTYERDIEIEDVVACDPPVPVSRLEDRLGRYSYAAAPGPATERLGQRLLDALFAEAPGLAPLLSQASDDIATMAQNDDHHKIRMQEKDAVATLLEAFHHDRSIVGEAGLLSPNKPFLDSLPGRHPGIDQDWLRFESWNGYDDIDYGTRIYENGSQRLLICNLTRRRAEDIDGVDLLYYNEFHQSFVLVQYKQFVSELGKLVYRGDPQLDEQLRRMRKIDDQCTAGSKAFDIRLHPKPCFLKLCEPGPFDRESTDLIKGFYLARKHFETVLRSTPHDNRLHGRRIGSAIAPRNINNSTFTTLLSQGWIGSCGTGSDFVREQARLSLEQRGSLVFGTHLGARVLGNGLRNVRY